MIAWNEKKNLALVEEYIETLEQRNELRNALKNLLACLYCEPNPYDHDCQWCADCKDRAYNEANNAITAAKSLQGGK